MNGPWLRIRSCAFTLIGRRSLHSFDGKVMWFRATDVPEIKPLQPDWQQTRPPAQFDKFASIDSARLEAAYQEGKQNETVQQDGLFSVDFANRLYKPTYWKGPAFKVIRGTWFYQTGMKPLPEDLAERVERLWHTRSEEPLDLGTDGLQVTFDYEADPQTAAFVGDGWLNAVKDLRMPKNQKLVRGFNRSTKVTDALRTGAGELLSKAAELPTSNKVKKLEADVLPKSALSQSMVSESATKPSSSSSSPAAPPAIETGPDRPVDHLIFCIHGIGQQLSARYESVSFVKDVNTFRDELGKTFNSDPKLHAKANSTTNHKVQALPVLWREGYKFGGEHIDPKLADITPSSMFPSENVLADVVLDFVMYTQPEQRKRIWAAAAKVMNHQFKNFCNNHPDFAKKPRVSIVAHSLGAVIANDLLRLDPYPLDFEVDTLFLLGSPLGILELLQGRKFTMDNLHAKAVYNLMRSADPVAARLEPLVIGSAIKAAPKQVPDSSGGIISQVKTFADEVTSRSASITSGASAIIKAMVSQANETNTKSSEPTEPLDQETAHDITESLRQFNRHGRLDFALPEGIDVSLLLGVAAHLMYFESPDVASFVLHELLGIDSMPEKRLMRAL